MPSETLSKSKTEDATPFFQELRALHGVLTRARFEAYQNGLSAKELARVLDDAEFLVNLLIGNEADMEELFRGTLQHLAKRCPVFEGVAARYDQEQETVSGSPINVSKTLK